MGKVKIGCTKLNIIHNKFDGQNVNGVNFKEAGKMGMQLIYTHDAPNDQAAIDAAKKLLKSDPDTRMLITTVLPGQANLFMN